MFSHSSAEKRLNAWRNVRAQKYSSPLAVAKNFGDIKVTQRYIDYYTPSSWPNVFEIVSDGIFCPTGVTLVLAATLYHLNFIKSEMITFPVISNNINGTAGAVLNLDGVIYNFLPGKAVDEDYMNDNSTIYKVHSLDSKELFK